MRCGGANEILPSTEEISRTAPADGSIGSARGESDDQIRRVRIRQQNHRVAPVTMRAQAARTRSASYAQRRVEGLERPALTCSGSTICLGRRAW